VRLSVNLLDTGQGEELEDCSMPDFFCCEEQGGQLQRKVVTRAAVLTALGDYTVLQDIGIPEAYEGQSFKWGGTLAESLPLAHAILSSCISTAYGYEDGQAGSALSAEFAENVICALNPQHSLSIEWFEVQSWIDARLNKDKRCIAGSLYRTRELERLLRAALNERSNESSFHSVSPAIWARWNLEGLLSTCHIKQLVEGTHFFRFADHLMDLKFKLYCLLEVDIPLYADGIQKWHLNPDDLESTPQGFACRLSQEVTIIVKSRAIWQSVMSIVYAYAGVTEPNPKTVEGLDGDQHKSEKEAFFSWVAGVPIWSSLETFRPIVQALDDLRTPEIHKLSRTRGDFTKQVLAPIDRCLV